MEMKHYFVVYREHNEEVYHRELVAICISLEQAVSLLDKPNYDLSIWETWFDVDGLIHSAIEIKEPFTATENK
jgi:hypothetical protein